MYPLYKTIANFQYSSEAQIVKGRLEAEGIGVFLMDEFTIDTDPLVSNAIGGVKLKVLSDDALKARHILNSINQYSLNNDGEEIHCPQCQSQKVQLFPTINDRKTFFWFIFGFIFSALPLFTKHKYKCEACRNEFEMR